MDFNDIWKVIVKMAVEQARQVTDDEKALKIKCLYKNWERQIGRDLTEGEYIQHEDKLYKVLQSHTVQESWIPGVGTESLYVVVDKKHEGTLDDPIPASVNMIYYSGKYYIEGDVLYLCTRDSGIALQFMPSALIGHYFQIVK